MQSWKLVFSRKKKRKVSRQCCWSLYKAVGSPLQKEKGPEIEEIGKIHTSQNPSLRTLAAKLTLRKVGGQGWYYKIEFTKKNMTL